MNSKQKLNTFSWTPVCSTEGSKKKKKLNQEMLAIAKTWSITYYSTKGGFICLFVCFDFIFIFFLFSPKKWSQLLF